VVMQLLFRWLLLLLCLNLLLLSLQLLLLMKICVPLQKLLQLHRATNDQTKLKSGRIKANLQCNDFIPR
jgi:hypothetical protein